MIPNYHSQITQIRRNLFNIIYVIDFSNLAHLMILKDAFEFVKNKICFRIGVVPRYDKDSGVGYITAKVVYEMRLKGTKWVLAFRDFVMGLLEMKVYSENDVIGIYEKVSGLRYDGVDVDVREMMDEANRFVGRLGVGEEGGIFFNGAYIPLQHVKRLI